MKIALAIVNVILILYVSYKVWQGEPSSLKKYFWPALVLKWLAGIGLGLVYTYYYTVADTFAYFQDGVKLAHLARTDIVGYIKFLWSGDQSFAVWPDLIFFQPRALFMSKITSLFCVITGDNYWVVSLYFSGVSFSGAWLLVKKIVSLNHAAKFPALLSFLFFPTIVFWSAGIVKESMAMGCLFFVSCVFVKVWKREAIHWTDGILSILSLWLLWNLKYYYLAIFLPVAFTTIAFRFVASKFSVRRLFPKVSLWFLIFAIQLLLVSVLHPNFYLERLMDVVVSSYHDFEMLSAPEDLIHYHALKATPWSLLLNAPWALFSGLFRPFIFEANTVFQYLVAVENLVILVLTLTALPKIKTLTHGRYRLLAFSIVVFAVLLCVFLALSTPNFGTLSRYRVGFLPYLVLVLTIENPLINKLVTSKIFRSVVR